jgi:hypothetical protein
MLRTFPATSYISSSFEGVLGNVILVAVFFAEVSSLDLQAHLHSAPDFLE